MARLTERALLARYDYRIACCAPRYRGSVLALTYMAYMCYHLSRKPISVVKNVLNQNCSSVLVPDGTFINDTNRNTWCDWAPFGECKVLLKFSQLGLICVGKSEFQVFPY